MSIALLVNILHLMYLLHIFPVCTYYVTLSMKSIVKMMD